MCVKPEVFFISCFDDSRVKEMDVYREKGEVERRK